MKLSFAVVILLMAGTLRAAQQIQTVTNEEAALVWQNSIEGSMYANDVDSANSTVNTPLKDGNFYKAQYQTDLRRTFSDEKTDFFQFSLTHSNDPAVLSSTQNQINNLQMGRSSPDYYVSAGDVAPNFSTLSSSLAVRGMLAQKILGDYTVSAFGGKVADSWEALSNSVLRSQFLRDVYGAKIETDLTDSLGIYFTAQSSQDDSGSLTDPATVGTLNPRNVQALTLGFKYEFASSLTLTGETAQSTAKTETQPDLDGHASVLDATWKKEVFSVRAGYHDLNPEFISLSSKAVAGIKESLVSADWKATQWLDLGAGLSKTVNTTLGTTFVPSSGRETNAENAKAGIRMAQNWNLTLQKSNSRTRELSSADVTSNEQTSAAVKYTAPVWNAGVNRTYLEVRNDSLSSTESNTTNTKFSVARSFSENREAVEAAWSVDVSFDYAVSDQELLAGAGSNTGSINRSLTVAGRLVKWGSLNVVLADTLTSRPGALADLKSQSKDVEAVHDFSETSKARLFFRDAENNSGDPLLATQERTVGASYTRAF